MGKAGYFGKVVLLLARTLKLSRTVSDCNTKHYLEINITSKKMLSKYLGRYYKESPDGELKMLNPSTDEHLIGKTVYFRSPITCTCGDEVCHKCFGFTSTLNFDISDGVAAYESEEVTEHTLVTLNLFNCWDISLRQSATKPIFILEGSTTIERVTIEKYYGE